MTLRFGLGTILFVLGSIGEVAAQQRAWMQTPSVARPAPIAAAPVAAPQPPVSAAAPSPSPPTYYPLPGLAAPTSSLAAGVAAPHGAYYTAQQSQPTLAPPLPNVAPLNTQVIADPRGSFAPAGIANSSSEAYGSTLAPMTTVPASTPALGMDDILNDGTTVFDPGDGYVPVADFGPWFFSASGLIMTRGEPNNVSLAAMNSTPNVGVLNTERVGIDWTGGYELRAGRRLGERWALEFDYWMLGATDDFARVRSETNGIDGRLDFQNLSYQGVPLSTIFFDSHEQQFSRRNNFENIELNLLQQASVVDPANRFGMTYFTGVRYFRFDETTNYKAAAAGAEFTDTYDGAQTFYYQRELNRLVGWQLGARGHVHLGPCWRLFAAPRFGVFGNRVAQTQVVCRALRTASNKTDVALIGQIDLGVAWQFLPRSSLFLAYRTMVAAGIATADDNYSRTLTDPASMASINSSSSLLLHGVQAGMQVQF